MTDTNRLSCPEHYGISQEEFISNDIFNNVKHTATQSALFKLYWKIDNVNDAGRWQVALDLLSDWVNEWQLSVSVSKCCVLNIGRAPHDVNSVL